MKSLSITSEELTLLLFASFQAGLKRGEERDCFPEDNPQLQDETSFLEFVEKIKKERNLVIPTGV